jgi:hypothetical protein
MGKRLSTGLVLGVASIGLVGGLAATNPRPPAYERYAVTRLTQYLESNLCAELPLTLGTALKSQCRQVLRANQDPVRTMIQHNTVSQNFLLFSLYKTTLTMPGLEFLPTYQVYTLGIFNSFITYKTEKL